jgi:hypothetical protein
MKLIQKNNNILLGFLTFITWLLLYIILARRAELRILKMQLVQDQAQKAMLFETIEKLKQDMLELTETAKIVTEQPVENSHAVFIVCSVLAVFIIFSFFYFSSVGPIFCPIRTMSRFDKHGNEFLLGIRYPADSPPSAGIRIAGTPDVIPISKFVETVSKNGVLQDSAANNVSVHISKNGITLMESFNTFVADVIGYFF